MKDWEGLNPTTPSLDALAAFVHFVRLLPTPENGGEHNIPVFDAVPPGHFEDVTGFHPPCRCDKLVDYFLGREVDVQKVNRVWGVRAGY